MLGLSRIGKIILGACVIGAACLAAGAIALGYLAINYGKGINLAQQGYRAVALGNYELAISYFDAALKEPLGPYQRSYVYVNRGAACNHERRFSEGIHDNSEALRLNPNLTPAFEGRAWAHREMGETDKELADLNEVLRQPSNSQFAYYARGMILYDRKDFDHALTDFQEAVRCAPDRTDGLFMRGLCYAAKNDLDRALASFDAIIMMESGNAQAFKERGQIYERRGEHAKSAHDLAESARLVSAEEKLEPPRAMDPTDYRYAYLLMRQAQAASDAGNFDRAIKLVNEAIARTLTDEFRSVLIMDRGNDYLAKRDFKAAAHDFDEAIALNPKNAGVYVNRGRMLEQEGRWAEAEKDYNEALRLNPLQWQAYYNRAAEFETLGIYYQALADLYKVTELNPTFISAYLKRANFYMSQSHANEAIGECNTAISMNPGSPKAYTTRAKAYVCNHDYGSALKDMEFSVQLKAERPEDPLNSLAWFYATCPEAKVRNGRKAISAATKACELSKWQKSFMIDTLAAAYAEAAEFEEAITYQHKAIEMATKDKSGLIDGMQQRLLLYQHHRAYREQSTTSPEE